MRHAISYLSTAAVGLSKKQINTLFDDVKENNNALDISGFLICSEGNFFQLLEGEYKVITGLFTKIKVDPRHNSLIKIVDRPVISKPFNKKYFCDFITDNALYPVHQIKNYLRYTQVLDKKSQNAVQRILEAMII